MESKPSAFEKLVYLLLFGAYLATLVLWMSMAPA